MDEKNATTYVAVYRRAKAERWIRAMRMCSMRRVLVRVGGLYRRRDSV